MAPNLRKFNDEELLKKLGRYCAFQERCEFEVSRKLQELNASEKQSEMIIKKLYADDFLNHARFLQAFVQGKFNGRKWGANRIRQELSFKGFSDSEINDALGFIPEEEYEESLEKFAKEKMASLKEEDIFKKRAKAAAFLIRKGYEPEMVWEHLKSNYDN